MKIYRYSRIRLSPGGCFRDWGPEQELGIFKSEKEARQALRRLLNLKRLYDMDIKLISYPADLDSRFEAIAKEHLHIPTLKTRKSDRLDFHDLPVSALRAALQAAYDLGRKDKK